MLQMKTTVDLIKAAGLQKEIKTIIGGAPVTAEFAQKIGADGYAPDAASAVHVVKGLVSL
jgi:5-methyltetrahydrofolate--homocysteine methyltransferase